MQHAPKVIKIEPQRMDVLDGIVYNLGEAVRKMELSDNWRYVAIDKDGGVFAFDAEPYKSEDIWKTKGDWTFVGSVWRGGSFGNDDPKVKGWESLCFRLPLEDDDDDDLSDMALLRAENKLLRDVIAQATLVLSGTTL